MGSRGSLRVSNGVIAAAWHTFDFLSLLSVLRSSPPPLLLPHITDEVLVYKLTVDRAGLGWAGERVGVTCHFPKRRRRQFFSSFPTTRNYRTVVNDCLRIVGVMTGT